MTVEAFDGIQIQTIRNVALLTENNFGIEPELNYYPKFINRVSNEMMAIALRIHTQTKFANSIFPENMEQYEIRLEAQKKARALAFSLEGQYHAALDVLKIDDDKYVDHIRHLIHQQNCIKSWIDKDKKIYKSRKWWKEQ